MAYGAILLFLLTEFIAFSALVKKDVLHLTTVPEFMLWFLPVFVAGPLCEGYFAYAQIRKLLSDGGTSETICRSIQYHVWFIVGGAYATVAYLLCLFAWLII